MWRYEMNKIIRSALASLSKYDFDLKNNYRETRELEKKVRPYTRKFTCNMMERILHLDGRDLLVREFSHSGRIEPIMIFFHGGGFVTGDFDSYRNICASLSEAFSRKVIAVDYRLAPEFKFPSAPEDAYESVQLILRRCEDIYQTSAGDAIVIGDSAGATLTVVSSMMARDRGGIVPKRQICVYPGAWFDFENSPFESVIENGNDYLLTKKKLIDYMELYSRSHEDFTNPYFAPLRHTDFSRLPETLVITMEFDPLRDEGNALAEKLSEGGCKVMHKCIKNGIHGIFSLPRSAPLNREIYQCIKQFLGE